MDTSPSWLLNRPSVCSHLGTLFWARRIETGKPVSWEFYSTFILLGCFLMNFVLLCKIPCLGWGVAWFNFISWFPVRILFCGLLLVLDWLAMRSREHTSWHGKFSVENLRSGIFTTEAEAMFEYVLYKLIYFSYLLLNLVLSVFVIIQISNETSEICFA